MKQEEYQKYRWFFTSSNKLIIGGKNAEQNESLLSKLKKQKHDYTIMHTALPGSPFSIILSKKSPSSSDLQQAAIFTASFSKQWKQRKNSAEIHIFKLSQLYKTKLMKIGTWGIKGKIKKISSPLFLVLTKQKSKLRAVPPQTPKQKKQILLKIIPGKTDKTIMLSKLQTILPSDISKEEILQAIPSGGIKIIK